ncbi:radical SAM protein [Streptomyces sp. YIM 132580]|uniref:radical SAM protein n=1 Tax=Streptomyces sp. YIM 132580 TaxID=2691958 RepID=UPI00136B63C4|nr:radical SAM protein [Streptomyces sp. YIM 132580]MXG30429.1 radical SAM protein [Streptomyces sp. YIM 132580]
MTQPRLIPASDGWWCLASGKAAHLPSVAVSEGRLVEPARRTLQERGFFDAPTPPFALTVLTATSCNLGCAYCFQNTEPSHAAKNPFAPARIDRRLLAQDDIERITSFVQERMTTLGAEKLSLLLFGGEPLLNPRACTELLHRLSPLGLVNAQMISNTVLLTPKLARQLHEAGLRRIQVSFDGNRADHDGTRIDHKGAGTYDRILRNVARAAQETALKWQFRVNVSHHNINGLDQLIDELASIPLATPATLSLALIDDVGVGYENQLAYADQLADRFLRLIDHALDRGLSVPVMGAPLTDCPFCGGFAGTTGAVVNADGTLYSCWETAGRPEWSVGNLIDGYLPDETINDKWVACDYAAKSHGAPETTRRFYDQVDCHILDRTHRASTTSPRPSPAGVAATTKSAHSPSVPPQ